METCLVLAPTEIVYRAVLETDFLDAVRSSRAVRMLFAIRSGVERLVSALLGRTASLLPEPATLKLVDIPRRGQWVKLGEDSPREIAFGLSVIAGNVNRVGCDAKYCEKAPV